MIESVGTPALRIGHAGPLYEGSITAEQAIAFAEATFDRQPFYLDGRAVPPLCSALLVLDATDACLEEAVEAGAIEGRQDDFLGVHAEHDVYFHGPLRPGQPVRWDSRLRSVNATPAGILITPQSIVYDLEGRPLVEHLWSTMLIKATTSHAGGPPLPVHRFPESARNTLLATETFSISHHQGRRYGEASGDMVGHALSDEIARSEGHPSKILQGMCSLSICAGVVVRALGNSAPDRLRRFAGRLSKPVLQGADFTVEVFDVGTDDRGVRIIAFEARQGEVLCVSHGRAEFATST